MKPLARLALGIPIVMVAIGCSERAETAAPPYVGEEMVQAEPMNGGMGSASTGTDVSAQVTTIPSTATVIWRSVQFANNLDGCAVYGVGSQYGGKIDTGNPGTYKIPGTNIDVTLVSLGLVNGVQAYQISIAPGYVMTDIFLKHSVNNNEWFEFTPGVSFASGIFTAQQALSHFSVCANDAALPLTFDHQALAQYDRTVDWDLTKTVAPALHEGMPGDTFQSIWSVVATKSALEDNERVSGTLTVGNPNGFSVPVSLEVTLNGTSVPVICPGTGNNTGTVPASGSLVCTYSASPADRSATLSTGILISGNPLIPGDTVVVPLSWQENLSGFEAGTLEDPRVAFSQSISASRTLDIPEPFVCPSDPGSYTDGFLQFTETNVVTLNGGINLADTATVDVICRMAPPARSETAWAANGDVPGSLRYTPRGNWATYLTYASAPKTVTLFAGQNQAVGTVSLSAPSGGLVTITINLNAGWTLDPDDDIHIQDYASPPSGNPAPGRFAHKFAPGATIQVPVNSFYGIHMVVWTSEP